jgi:hypothetical protein
MAGRTLAPSRKAPALPKKAVAPARQPAAHPARLRVAAVASAAALAMAALTLALSRSGDDDLPAGPGHRAPSVAPVYDGSTYESENVSLKFNPPPPAPADEDAAEEEESP